MRLSHLPYYQDRSSIANLCCDFPADELLIEGLNGMQCHLFSIGQNIEIPVLRVMNTAHYLAAYMFSTKCSGDRIEYDMMVYDSMGRDRQLMAITLITLAAMLDRTDGMRARHCRSILLEDRNEDFYEGMNLYERFLRNSERHFEEQDFMTDVMAEITDLRQLTQQLINDKQQLQKQLKTMENQQNIQYNIGTQYNYYAPIINNYCTPSTITETHQWKETMPEYEVRQSTVPDHATAHAVSMPFLVPDKLSELGTYSVAEFEALYHDAAKAGAPKLVKFIKHYRELEVLNTDGYNKKQTFEELKAYFGKEISFGYPNFAAYY